MLINDLETVDRGRVLGQDCGIEDKIQPQFVKLRPRIAPKDHQSPKPILKTKAGRRR